MLLDLHTDFTGGRLSGLVFPSFEDSHLLKNNFPQFVVITDLEPDILECEVKWALESITLNKASGGDGSPVELFQILKDDAVK